GATIVGDAIAGAGNIAATAALNTLVNGGPVRINTGVQDRLFVGTNLGVYQTSGVVADVATAMPRLPGGMPGQVRFEDPGKPQNFIVVATKDNTDTHNGVTVSFALGAPAAGQEFATWDANARTLIFTVHADSTA